jgi:hypothetical protein
MRGIAIRETLTYEWEQRGVIYSSAKKELKSIPAALS